jgi:hypothetical protein
MTYGGLRTWHRTHALMAVSHSAELVRGDLLC